MKELKNRDIPYKIYLSEDEMPRYWYNVRADMKKKPAPLLNPGTGAHDAGGDEPRVLRPSWQSRSWTTTRRYIDIPEDVRNFYKMYRPSPLVRAYCLEEKLGTPAHIYYKFEGNNTSGSHKLNSAIAQAYYAKEQGLTGVTTETGAGQWGTALSRWPAHYWGSTARLHGEVLLRAEALPPRGHARPTARTSRRLRPTRPRSAGKSLRSIPTPPALSAARSARPSRRPDARLPLCAGQRAQSGAAAPVGHRSGDEGRAGEVRRQARHRHRLRRRRLEPRRPDRALHGREAPRRSATTRIIAVEPASCPSLTRGKFAYDFCDTGKICPLAKMYTLGQRLHPLCQPRRRPALPRHEQHRLPAVPRRYLEAAAWSRPPCSRRPELFARCEGILPAPEQPRHPRGHGRGAEVQGDRRGEDDRLRPHRHGLLRHGTPTEATTTAR